MANFPVNPGNPAVVSTAESDTETTANPGAGPAPEPNDLICDRTGFRVTRHEGLVEEWTGAKVRKESLDPRHPQDFVRARPEDGGAAGGAFSQNGSADIYGTGVLNEITGEIEVKASGRIRIGPGPFTLVGTGIDDNQIDLSWTQPAEPVFDVIKFVVFRDVDFSGTATYLTQLDGETLSYSDTTVDRTSESYTYFVLAIDAGNNFRWANQADLTLTGTNGETVTGSTGAYPHPGGTSGDNLPGSADGPPDPGDTGTVNDSSQSTTLPSPKAFTISVANTPGNGWGWDPPEGSISPGSAAVGPYTFLSFYGSENSFILDTTVDNFWSKIRDLGFLFLSFEASEDASGEVRVVILQDTFDLPVGEGGLLANSEGGVNTYFLGVGSIYNWDSSDDGLDKEIIFYGL